MVETCGPTPDELVLLPNPDFPNIVLFSSSSPFLTTLLSPLGCPEGALGVPRNLLGLKRFKVRGVAPFTREFVTWGIGVLAGVRAD